ncbi:MAG: hypothetical protein WA971_03980 [Microbacterium sp.]
MARGNQNAQRARNDAERARRYAARAAWHESRIRRRVRDNVIASVVGGVLVLAAIGSQVAHAQNDPPTPSPSPSPAATNPSTPGPSQTPEATPTP